MRLEFGRTDEFINTQYAPLAALLAHYQHDQLLQALQQVAIPMKSCTFTPHDKLQQVLVSILAGCATLSEVNQTLKPELSLARVGGWPRFADQSGLSRTLDALTLMNLEQLQMAVRHIWQSVSQACQHDWRGYLWLDFDLSGLPCSKRAQASQKGYFSGKKTARAGSWHASVPSSTAKRFGRTCIPAINTPLPVCGPPCGRPKVP